MMPVSLKIHAEQLSKTCKLTGARWAAWFTRAGSRWAIRLEHGLGKRRRQVLEDFVHEKDTAAWLGGAFGSGRVRSRSTGADGRGLGCDRVYVYPNLEAHAALVVGADDFTSTSSGFWRILALNGPEALDSAADIPYLEPPVVWPSETDLEGFDPEAVFGWALQVLGEALGASMGVLLIRRGDLLRLEAGWNTTGIPPRKEIHMTAAPVLGELGRTHEIVILADPDDPLLRFIGFAGNSQNTAGAAVPVVIGNRLIGVAVFAAVELRLGADSTALQVERLLARTAHVIENALIFREAARYLQQFAVLNDLAAVVGTGADVEAVSTRVVGRLQRLFRTEQAAIFLLTADGLSLQEYGRREGRQPVHVPVNTSLVGYVVESGQTYRTGDVSRAPRFLVEERRPIRSALVVPLRARSQVIGVMVVESTESDAFSGQDEQLLQVIAGYLAGLLENVRLYEDARQRADDLALIHKVIQHVAGLDDDKAIARTAARLLGEFFEYEFVILELVETPSAGTQNLVCVGIGGSMSHLVPENLCYPVEQGITGRVYRSGRPALVQEAVLDPDYFSVTGWQAGSELCVPLIDHEQVIGVLDLESSRPHSFTENDVQLARSLASVLAGMIGNARRFQESQELVHLLQAARETALDIAAELDLDSTLRRIIQRACSLVGAKGAEVGWLDKNSPGVLILISETPWNLRLEGARPLGRGITGRLAETRQPLSIVNYNEWEGRLYPDQVMPFNSAAGVPLMYKGKLVGTLTVMDDDPHHEFGRDDLRLLELLGSQAAISITNARLMQELEERFQAQKLAERQLLHSARLAALGQLAAGVAHELNNPLTTVYGFVELALDELPGDLRQRAELELALQEAERANQVVRRLLDFARQGEEQRQLFNLNELVTSVIELIQHVAQTGGVQVETDLETGLPQMEGFPNQIKQVFLNLVQNALQAMPDGGTLRLCSRRARREGLDGVQADVCDSGEGIPVDLQERVFEPFFTTRPAGKGTGLGLSISQSIIADHGGTLNVRSPISIPGSSPPCGKKAVARPPGPYADGEQAGCCFSVWLPLRPLPAD